MRWETRRARFISLANVTIRLRQATIKREECNRLVIVRQIQVVTRNGMVAPRGRWYPLFVRKIRLCDKITRLKIYESRDKS